MSSHLVEVTLGISPVLNENQSHPLKNDYENNFFGPLSIKVEI